MTTFYILKNSENKRAKYKRSLYIKKHHEYFMRNKYLSVDFYTSRGNLLQIKRILL